ncbi:hypothetical protein FOZ63_014146, partial [Perkinsus olseni]
DGPSHLDDVADEDAWLRSVFREEELEAPGQQRGPSSEQSDAAQDVDMDPQQRTTEDAPDTVMENVRSSCQGDNPCEDVDLIPARRTDWYSMWDKDDPTELVDAGLAKFKGLPATDALDLLPDEHRARGIAALQVVTRHHPYLVEARTKAKSVSPSAGARVGPAHEAPSSVLAPPCPTASAAASAANEAPSSVEDAEDPRTLWRREQLVKFGKMKLQQQLEVAANTDVLVGVHGAALWWLVLLADCGRVLELGTGADGHYRNLATFRGISHTFIDQRVGHTAREFEWDLKRLDASVTEA